MGGSQEVRIIQSNDDNGWPELYLRPFHEALTKSGHNVVSAPAETKLGRGTLPLHIHPHNPSSQVQWLATRRRRAGHGPKPSYICLRVRQLSGRQQQCDWSALSYIPTSVALSASFASRAAVSAPSAPKSIIHKSDKVSHITTHRSQASSPGSTAKYEHISHPRLAEAPRPSPPSQSCRSARQVDTNCQRE